MNKNNFPLVSIIIVNYNGKNCLENCLKSLLSLNYPQDKLEIIVVDNCSDDDSFTKAKKICPGAKFIQNDTNNYCKANNLGIKNARGRYIAFLNNDVVVNTDWLIELTRVMEEKKEVGLAGGKIMFMEGGLIQSAGLEEYPGFYWGDRGFKEQDNGQYDNNNEEVPGLCGAAVVYRKECFSSIGFFDEDFVMYLEDLDMAFRCREKGWKVLYCPKSVVYHYFRGTADSEKVRCFSETNRLLLIAKHFPGKLADALYGKGYFSEIPNQNSSQRSIYNVMPLIFSKLLETNTAGNIKSILPEIFRNLGNIANLEKDIFMRRLEWMADMQNASVTKLQQDNAELSSQIERIKKELIIKDSDLSKLQQENTRLNSQYANVREEIIAKDVSLAKLISQIEKIKEELSVKNSDLARLQQDNAGLNSQIEKIKKDLVARDSDLAKLQQVHIQLKLQLEKAAEVINIKDQLLRNTSNELEALKFDWERAADLEKKVKYLIIKPYRISVEDTEKVIAVIKRKYPQSSVCLVANLLQGEYERLSRNEGIDIKLLYQPGKKTFSHPEIVKLIFMFWFIRFDVVVTLVSQSQNNDYDGYKKARLLSLLSGARTRRVCPVS